MKPSKEFCFKEWLGGEQCSMSMESVCGSPASTHYSARTQKFLSFSMSTQTKQYSDRVVWTPDMTANHNIRMQPAGYEKIFHDIQIKILLWEQTCPLGGDGVALNYQLFCNQNFSFLSDLMYKHDLLGKLWTISQSSPIMTQTRRVFVVKNRLAEHQNRPGEH